LIHGGADKLVKPWNSEQMADAYRRAGRLVRQLEIGRLGHADLLFAIARPLRWRAPVLAEMLSFIDDQSRMAVAVAE
jgi:dipeptidyl aminopeptidase/acylaminoacyl peptidase